MAMPNPAATRDSSARSTQARLYLDFGVPSGTFIMKSSPKVEPMSKEQFLFVDGDKYEWAKASISGAELRVLAAIPQNAQIYLKLPGKPDQTVSDQTTVDLATLHGPAKFSTQSPGSQAG